jgi:hypothetical protein
VANARPVIVIFTAEFDTDPPEQQLQFMTARKTIDHSDVTVSARRRLSARRAQRGLGLFGTLLIVAIAAAALYYVYLGVTGEDEEPSCRGTYNACQQNCRRTRTETVALQNCQDFCWRELAQCERRSP